MVGMNSQVAQPKPPGPPKGLGPTGRALWRRVVEAYTLRPDELELLRLLALATDHVTRIESKLKAAQVVSTGSAGQLTGHPLLAEFRAHTDTVQRLTKQLGLPDPKVTHRKQKASNRPLVHMARGGVSQHGGVA